MSESEVLDMATDNEFLDDSIVLNGGYLDNWFLKMPEPYLQKDDVFALNKTFALYAYYEEKDWHLVKESETDDILYDKLMAEYKKNFFMGETQVGGQTRFKYCSKHDISSSYVFEDVTV